MNNLFSSLRLRVALIIGTMLVAACSDNDSTPTRVDPPAPQVVRMFNVEVINLTNGQPFSPLAVILHAEGTLWELNQPATVALETLAESGDNSQILNQSFVLNRASGSAPLVPGMTESLTAGTNRTGELYLSVATMLVNTNDAFTGLNRIDVTNMVVGDSMNYRTSTYDSGTEANSEVSGTIPGPADGGEGFNSVRDDVDFVTMHAGVVTVDDGLSTSVLKESHRFDNPTAAIKITRTQ